MQFFHWELLLKIHIRRRSRLWTQKTLSIVSTVTLTIQILTSYCLLSIIPYLIPIVNHQICLLTKKNNISQYDTTQGDNLAMSMHGIVFGRYLKFLTIASQFKSGMWTMATLSALLCSLFRLSFYQMANHYQRTSFGKNRADFCSRQNGYIWRL